MSFTPALVASGRFTPEIAAILRRAGLHHGDDPNRGWPFLTVLGHIFVTTKARALADILEIREDDPAQSVADSDVVLARLPEIRDLLEDPTIVDVMAALADEGVDFSLVE